jgi:hypothetical protein
MLQDADENEVAAASAIEGFDLAFIGIKTLSDSLISLFSMTEKQSFVKSLDSCLNTMRARDETKAFLCELLTKHNLLT